MSSYPQPLAGFDLGEFNSFYFSWMNQSLSLELADQRYLHQTGGHITGSLTIDGVCDVGSLTINGSALDLSMITGITHGIVSADKAVIVDANKDISGFRNLTAVNLTGTLQTAAQPSITSVGTLTALTVSGSINGTIGTAAQPNITSLGSLTTLTVSSNINNVMTVENTNSNGHGNILFKAGGATDVEVGVRGSTDTRAGAFYIYQGGYRLLVNTSGYVAIGSSVALYTLDVNGDCNLTAGCNYRIGGAVILNGSGVLQVAAQPNITSLGTLTSLTSSGTIQGATLTSTGDIYVSSGGYLRKAGGLALMDSNGILQVAAQTNITSVGTLSSLVVSTNSSYTRASSSGTESAIKVSSMVSNCTSSAGTDTTTRTGFYIPSATFSASSATTTNNACSLFVDGDPSAGANMTLGSSYAAWIRGKCNVEQLAVAGQLIINGATQAITTSGIITSSNTTNSTAYTNGALVLAGGVGIAKDTYINGTLNSLTSTSLNGTIGGSLTSGYLNFTTNGTYSSANGLSWYGGTANQPKCYLFRVSDSNALCIGYQNVSASTNRPTQLLRLVCQLDPSAQVAGLSAYDYPYLSTIEFSDKPSVGWNGWTIAFGARQGFSSPNLGAGYPSVSSLTTSANNLNIVAGSNSVLSTNNNLLISSTVGHCLNTLTPVGGYALTIGVGGYNGTANGVYITGSSSCLVLHNNQGAGSASRTTLQFDDPDGNGYEFGVRGQGDTIKGWYMYDHSSYRMTCVLGDWTFDDAGTRNARVNINGYKTYQYNTYKRYNLITGSYQTSAAIDNVNLSLYTSSNIWCDGGGVYTSSDGRLKTRIHDYDITEAEYMSLKPKRYIKDNRWDIGLIAQEVVRSHANYPDFIMAVPNSDMVRKAEEDPSDGYAWSLKYDRLSIINMKMVQKNVERIHELESKMKQQEEMIRELRDLVNTLGTQALHH